MRLVRYLTALGERGGDPIDADDDDGHVQQGGQVGQERQAT